MTWFEWLITNAVTATVLAGIVFGITRFVKQPPVVYGLWMVVLLKLATPPIVEIPIVTHWSERPGQVITVHLPDPQTAVARPQLVLREVSEDAPRSPARTVDDPAEVAVRTDRDSTIATAGVGTGSTPSVDGTVGAEWWMALGLWIVWSTGALLFLTLLVRRTLRFGRILREAPVADEPVRERARALAQSFGLSASPEVRAVKSVIPPLLWPFGRGSTVLIPADLLARLDDRQLETLLAHEIAHLRRRDHWVRVFEIALLTVYWWFPVLRGVLRALRDAEEQCCDAWVVWHFPNHARDYARTLLTTVDYLSENYENETRTSKPALSPPAVLPAAMSVGGRSGRFEPLKRRFEMILNRRFARRLSPTAKIGLIAASLLVLPLAPLAVSAETAGKDKILIIKADGSKYEYEVSGDVATDVQAAIDDVLKKSKGTHSQRRVITRKSTSGGGQSQDVEIQKQAIIVGPDGKREVIELRGGDDDGRTRLRVRSHGDGGDDVDVEIHGQAIIVGPDGKKQVIELDAGDGQKTRRLRLHQHGDDGDVEVIELDGDDRKRLRLFGRGGKGQAPKVVERDGKITVIIGDEKHEFDLGGSKKSDPFGGHGQGKSFSKSSGKVIVVGPDGKLREHSFGDDDAFDDFDMDMDFDFDFDVEDLFGDIDFDFDPDDFHGHDMHGFDEHIRKMIEQSLKQGMGLKDLHIDMDPFGRGKSKRKSEHKTERSKRRVFTLGEDGDVIELELDARGFGDGSKSTIEGKIEMIGPDGKKWSHSFDGDGGVDLGGSIDQMIQKAIEEALDGKDIDEEIERAIREALKGVERPERRPERRRTFRFGSGGQGQGGVFFGPGQNEKPGSFLFGPGRRGAKIELGPIDLKLKAGDLRGAIDDLEPTMKKLEEAIEALESGEDKPEKTQKKLKKKTVL